jgi:hypothetical protein
VCNESVSAVVLDERKSGHHSQAVVWYDKFSDVERNMTLNGHHYPDGLLIGCYGVFDREVLLLDFSHNEIILSSTLATMSAALGSALVFVAFIVWCCLRTSFEEKKNDGNIEGSGGDDSFKLCNKTRDNWQGQSLRLPDRVCYGDGPITRSMTKRMRHEFQRAVDYDER